MSIFSIGYAFLGGIVTGCGLSLGFVFVYYCRQKVKANKFLKKGNCSSKFQSTADLLASSSLSKRGIAHASMRIAEDTIEYAATSIGLVLKKHVDSDTRITILDELNEELGKRN